MLFMLIILACVSFYFIKEIDLDIAKNGYVYIILFFLPPLLLLILLKRLKKWSIETVLFVICVTAVVFIVISGRHHRAIDKEYIDKTGGVMNVGIIKEIEISYGSSYITISYLNNQKSQFGTKFSRSASFVDDILVGDTILILSSIIDSTIDEFLYKHPAKEKIQQCKDGCYYLDGRIFDRFEIEKTLSIDSTNANNRDFAVNQFYVNQIKKQIQYLYAEGLLEDTSYYIQTGYIFRKDSRGITKQFNTMVYVGIKKNKLWKHEMSMFKDIHEGDTILMKLSNKDSEYNEVISWHPTPEEMEKYKNPVRITESTD